MDCQICLAGLRLARLMLLLALVLPALAHAEPVPLPDAATSTALDASLLAMRGHQVVLLFTERSRLAGRLTDVTNGWLTLVLPRTGEVRSVERARVLGLATAEDFQPEPVSVQDMPRHFGLEFGVLPALMADFEWGRSYSFLSASLLWPMVVDSSSNPLAAAIGSGLSVSIAPDSRWRFDLFAQLLAATFNSRSDFGFAGGVGLGAHYTSVNGFTLAFKVPAIGFGPAGGSSKISDSMLNYYAGSFVCTPFFSLGYRFE